MGKWSLLLVLPLAFGGCGGGDDESAEIDEAPVEAVPPPPETYSAEDTAAASPNSQRIAVENHLEEPLEVVATLEGRTEPLGTVLGHASGEFFIQAAAGTEVELVARAADGDPEYRETFVLGEPIRWVPGEGTTPETR